MYDINYSPRRFYYNTSSISLQYAEFVICNVMNSIRKELHHYIENLTTSDKLHLAQPNEENKAILQNFYL